MFKDYYAILNIRKNAKLDAIRQAYKYQALKWHPDKNPSKDTTKMMQDINEAYLILSDQDARLRYDQEYNYFNQEFSATTSTDNSSKRESYDIRDEILKRWINNARRQSVILAKQTVEDIVGMTRVGCRAAFDKAKYWILAYIIIQIIYILVYMFSNK